MGAWVLILFVAVGDISEPPRTISVTPIYFQTEAACQAAARDLRVGGVWPDTRFSAECVSTSTGQH